MMALPMFKLLSLLLFIPAWETYQSETISKLPQIAGWCSPEKARLLMDFIHEHKPEICVEIGAFGGSTTFPLARALQYEHKGVLYAIDAWDNSAAAESFAPGEPDHDWWSKVDMKAIRSGFVSLIKKEQLSRCKAIPQRFEEAAAQFADGSIDLLYVDGSAASLREVELYFPKVKQGGYIWLNDAHYDSKNKAVAFLMRNCEWLKKKSLKNQCVLFKKK